ncbi:hypothetical protein [Solidesulfovibrio carbinolicus]|uniref:Uncharacterized protein n=1 Tax=Solidesulfovibrio carbinolicus TaxID=296842 RepID=A0A4P6HQS4_9BACT|nr:hypothetical protein [Solidesulfovibrio carbinolicus]QAZ69064.1 hypothetical protein C3Y92_18210 [Solidesulfovibrio carbinolicus]
MDAVSGGSAKPTTSALDQQTMGAQVVTQTLDKLNTNANGKLDADYDFQTKVLSAMGKGVHVNTSA